MKAINTTGNDHMGYKDQKRHAWLFSVLVPVLWGSFIFSAWFVATQSLPWHANIAMVMITGSVGGFCINLGHEMGHKNTPLERWLTRFILAPSGYGHFTIEHNRGHHRDVATPREPASSRKGESIYRFVLRDGRTAAGRCGTRCSPHQFGSAPTRCAHQALWPD